jgi:hypothetical protein
MCIIFNAGMRKGSGFTSKRGERGQGKQTVMVIGHGGCHCLCHEKEVSRTEQNSCCCQWQNALAIRAQPFWVTEKLYTKTFFTDRTLMLPHFALSWAKRTRLRIKQTLLLLYTRA